MKLPHLPTLSLRARFALGVGIMLLPFLLVAAVRQFYLLPRLVGPLEEIVYKVAEEMRPVATLEATLRKASHTGDNYFLLGNPATHEAFERSIRQVEEAFMAASPERFRAENERDILRAARVEWERARHLAKVLLRLPDPASKTVAMRDKEEFEAHIGRAANILEKMQGHFDRKIGEERVKAGVAKQQATLLAAVALAIVLGIALATGTLLGRYVLASVEDLRRTARRLEGGDLSARAVLDRKDELGQLAQRFNAMAEALEKSRAAFDERSSQLNALNQIAIAITSLLSLQDILNEIMRRGIALTGAKASCIAFYDEATALFTQWVTQGLSEHFIQNISFQPGGLADETFTTASYILSNNRPETKHKLSRLAREEGLHCFICLPLTSRDRRLGVIYFYRTDRDTFTPTEIELLATFASLAAQAIENARLYAQVQEQARTDALTGLNNRGEFQRQLKEEEDRSRRYHRSFSLLVLDIDHFKTVNDSYGHQAGDEVLRALAARLREQLRPADHAARYGGEELVVILPETSNEGALALAERLRTSVAGAAIPVTEGRTIPVTISIGVATFPADAESETALIAAADKALYAAKQAGRNRVCRFMPA